jgi:hypothetical protein
MKKLKLENDVQYDFSLVGITCVLKEYRLAWKLNKLLEIQLTKEKDIEIEFLKNQNLIISNYLHETENSQIRLLKNKSADEFTIQSAYLLPELKEFDYFIMIRGFEDTFSMEVFKNRIASIAEVHYTKEFAIENLKSKENLIF